jgi:4'-phosphopantetheinyl transferase EntD
VTALFRTLVPSGVVVVEGPILTEEIQLYDEEMAEITGASQTRRVEFLTGRLYARKALVSLGVVDHPLRVGSGHQPMWPEGIVGSISHSATWCVVVAARDSLISNIGVHVQDHSLGDGAPVSRGAPLRSGADVSGTEVATDQELDDLRAAGVDDPVALVVSAKTSVCKAWHGDPVAAFDDVTIRVVGTGLVGELDADACRARFEIRWATGGSRLATVAVPA